MAATQPRSSRFAVPDRQPGTRQFRTCAPEQGDQRRPNRGRNMHWAGVVRQQHIASLQGRTQFTQRCLSGQRSDGPGGAGLSSLNIARDGFAQIAICRAAKNPPPATGPTLQFNRSGHEPLPKPAFGRSISGGCVQAEEQQGRSWVFTTPDLQDQRSHWSRERIRETAEAAERFRFLEEEVGSMMLGAARYPLSFPETSTLILGTKSAAQADINFGQVPGSVLDARVLESIERIQAAFVDPPPMSGE